jgi:hypothetical protein
MSHIIKKLSARTLLIVALAACVSALTAGVASAWTPSQVKFYVTVGGSTDLTSCGQDASHGCDLETLINGIPAAPPAPAVASPLRDGDEVIIEPGPGGAPYTTSQSLQLNRVLFVHGDFSKANRPVITSATANPVLQENGSNAQLGLEGSIVSYLDLENTGTVVPGAALTVAGEGSIAEQIFASSAEQVGNSRGTCNITFGQLRDSVCFNAALNGDALRIFSNDLPIAVNNVDAIATNPSGVAIYAEQHIQGGHGRATLTNVVARGGTATGHDIYLDTLTPAIDANLQGSTFTLAAQNSNFDPGQVVVGPSPSAPTGTPNVGMTFEDDGDNVSALPHFVGGPDGGPNHDFSEADDSPTRLVGFTDLFDNGAFDFLRSPRQLYGVTDIGAYQHSVPPPPPPTTTTTTTTTTTPPPTTSSTTTTTPPPPPPTTTPAPDKTPPAFSATSLKPGNFAVIAGKKRKKRIHYGGSLKFTLSEQANVVGSVALKTKGRLVGKTCKKQTKSNAKRRSCVLYVQKGKLFAKAFPVGASTVALNGKAGTKKLAPGVYRLQLVGTDPSQNASLPRTMQFKIVKG